jgi:hypothetical protein
VKRALGLRAEAKQVHWAVVEGTRENPILVDHGSAAAPVDLDDAPALSWYNNRVKHLIQSHHPDLATIRTAESIARGSNKEGNRRRLRIEGVLLQTIDSRGLKVTMGALAMMSGRLGSQAKQYLDSGDLRGLDISAFPLPSKEAILVAVAALP